jgi:sortase A
VSGGDAVRTGLRGLGQTLITFGVVVLLFCVYELEVTGLYTAQQQDRLGRQLTQQWAQEPITPAQPGQPARPVPVALSLGGALARLHVPRFGAQYAEVVVEGVATEDLKRGPGHYPGTALPGALGNVVLSGHRTTYGQPFNRLDELSPGDAVVLETRDTWFTYRVTGTTIVSPTAIEVTYPVPGRAGQPPTQHLLTMTTCNPKYSARQRLVVRAVLQGQLPKANGPPPALAPRT